MQNYITNKISEGFYSIEQGFVRSFEGKANCYETDGVSFYAL